MASTSASTPKGDSGQKAKGSKAKCCFVGCGLTQRQNPHLHFFKFPINRPNVLEQWLVNCGNEDLISLPDKTLYSKKVCEKHFTIDCFTNLTKKYLKKDAAPTELQCHDSDDEIPDQSVSLSSDNTDQLYTQIETDNNANNDYEKEEPPEGSKMQCKTFVSPKTPTTPQYKRYRSVKNRTPTPRKTTLTPVKRKLLSRLKSSEKTKKKFQARARRIALKRQKLSKQELVSAVKEYLPPVVHKFFTMQLNHAGSLKKTWSEEERRIALSMSYKSPRLYEQMRKDGFALPSKSTIARWLQEVDLRPGICQDLVNTMKAKVECMTEWEKNLWSYLMKCRSKQVQ